MVGDLSNKARFMSQLILLVLTLLRCRLNIVGKDVGSALTSLGLCK